MKIEIKIVRKLGLPVSALPENAPVKAICKNIGSQKRCQSFSSSSKIN